MFDASNPIFQIFIPAKVWDNARLLASDPAYLARLQNLPKHMLRTWLEGDWDIAAGGYLTGVWDPARPVVAPFLPPAGLGQIIAGMRGSPIECYGTIDCQAFGSALEMGGGGKEFGRCLAQHAGTDVRCGRQITVRRPRNPAGDLCQRPERTLDTRGRRPVRGVHRNVTEAAHGPASSFGDMLRTLP